MSKRHRIDSLETLARVYGETANKDDLITDLRSWIELQVATEKLSDALGLAGSVSTAGHFDWVDDGRHDATINVTLV